MTEHHPWERADEPGSERPSGPPRTGPVRPEQYQSGPVPPGSYPPALGPLPSFESPPDPLAGPDAQPSTGSSTLFSTKSSASKKKERSIFLELVMVGLLALLLALVLRVFVTQVYAISGHSMEPTLHDGEMVMIHKLSPAFMDVSHGDLVIFESPRHSRKDLIKRVIAVAGDTVKIENNRVWINDTELDEGYIRRSINRSVEKTWRIEKGKIFVLGDNRPQSQDSRHFGPVSLTSIKGEVFLRLWPLRDMTTFP